MATETCHILRPGPAGLRHLWWLRPCPTVFTHIFTHGSPVSRLLVIPLDGRLLARFPRVFQADCLDFLGGELPAVVHSRTDLASPSPRRRRGEILCPERPGPALQRPHRVDRAPSMPIAGRNEEYAITVRLLHQRVPETDPPEVLLGKPLVLATEIDGNPPNFLAGYPDIPGRPRAAVATLAARET